MSSLNPSRRIFPVVAQILAGASATCLAALVMFVVAFREVFQDTCNETHVRLFALAVPLAGLCFALPGLARFPRLRLAFASFTLGCVALAFVALFGNVVCGGD